MQLPENANAAWQKNWFQFVVENESNQLSKNIMHIQENEVAPQTSQIHLQNAKHAASVFRKQPLKFLSTNVGTKNLCTIMQSPENVQKHINPRCYPTILQQIQSCVQRRHLLSPNSSCHTKSCRNVAHVHRINGSLYFHTPFCYDFHAVQPRKFTTCNTMQICIHLI